MADCVSLFSLDKVDLVPGAVEVAVPREHCIERMLHRESAALYRETVCGAND